MSGICAAAGAGAEASVRAMLGRLSAEGQGGGHVRVSEELALGHTRRPGAAGRAGAPLLRAGVSVVVDGEIFGATALLAEPDRHVLDLYLGDRLDELARLNGSFAVAIVDAARRRMILAADRLGTRALYVWTRGAEAAAASRLDALLGDGRVPRRLSVQGTIEMLTFGRTFGEQTHYSDVGCLRGAEIVTVADGAASRRQTRRLAWRRPAGSRRETAERLAAAMRRAVGRRIEPGRRNGLLLSGGFDSRMVLGAADPGAPLHCVTAASHRNAEVEIASRAARAAGREFRFVEVPPLSLSETFDDATRACDGLFAAPINLFGILPALARDYDVLFSGHGVDYTLRGMYLPKATLRVAGTRTVMPWLGRVGDGSAAEVAGRQLTGIKPASLDLALTPEARADCDGRRRRALEAALAHADPAEPADAWDACILHSQVRHYANSDFVAMSRFVDHRAPVLDAEVLDIYFEMPAAWRAEGRVAEEAARLLSPDLMRLPNANTGFPAGWPGWLQVALVLGRAALRRLGVLARPRLPDRLATAGSWVDFPELFRRDERLVARVRGLCENEALLATGLFSAAGLKALAEQHLGGTHDHVKLLHLLATLASWHERHGFDAVVA